MNYIAMLALLKALTQEVNLLEIELAQLQASSTVAVVTTTPIVFPTSTYQWSPPAKTPPTFQQTQPTLGAAPVTTFTNIQMVGGNVDNGVPIFATGVLDTNVCVTLFDQNGNIIENASATISDDSLSPTYAQLRDLNGITFSDTYNFLEPNAICNYKMETPTPHYTTGPGYMFDYIPPTDGQHAFGISALGNNDSIEVNSITQ